ncbi:MAG: N-6 DNA methylase, partial [Actinobacteria bacterium]|nr:N-6 DNA methylase [Actinomycetota bacterium]
MQIYLAEHLTRNRRIQLGGYYTPEKLVNRVYELIKPHLIAKKEDAVVFDSAGGCGAFLVNYESYNYRIADYDKEACGTLVNRFDKNNVFCTNSLVGVKREKFIIPESSYLIMVGNPPYNDTTSEFKKGEKGENQCDPDLFDRDIGISFLRSYYKLRADLVCVLHPLAYLIKETNFNRLREFKDHYRLKTGDIFSSDIFLGTGLTKFPILIALYEKSNRGMTFDYILSCRFNLLERARTFVLADYKTTDGYIEKYPPRKNAPKISPIGLYYYSFRDFNSLKRNASFIAKQIPNAIVVTVENFYKYSYLYALKRLFNPEDSWLYGATDDAIRLKAG